MRTKYYLNAIILLALALTGTTSAVAQDDAINIALGKIPTTDLSKLPEPNFKAGDPIYFILVVNKGIPHTLRDLVSTNPETGEKNIFVCFDMVSASMREVCKGVLKTPITDEDLNGKSLVYTVIPPTIDMNAENTAAIEALLKGFAGKYGSDVELKVRLTNFDTKAHAFLRAPISMSGWTGSHWDQYYSRFLDGKKAAQRQRQLDASENESLPQSAMLDAVTERQVFQLAREEFSGTHRLYKVAFFDRDWTYYRNQFGVLTGRGIRVLFMMKRLDNGDCEIHYTMYARQDHIAGNQFSSLSLRWRDDREAIRLVKCEKFAGLK